MSAGVIHWNGKAIFMSENKITNSSTFSSMDCMIKGYECIAGPKESHGTGLVFFVEGYTGIDDDDDDDHDLEAGA